MRSDLNAFIIILCQISQSFSTLWPLSEDRTLYYTEEFSSKYGHSPKVYNVITEDGYVLLLHHLPGNGRKNIPVLLMHGLFCSADTWIFRGNTSIPIALANAGYDVFLGNCRGNSYSRRHLSLDPDSDKSFWNFTFHEQAVYDLTAIIDTVLDKSEADKLNAIGHSLGNTLFYILGATKPEYNEKVNLLIALSPVCYLHNAPAPVKIALNTALMFEDTAKLLNMEELLGSGLSNFLFKFLCSLPVIGYKLCIEAVLFTFVGADSGEVGPDIMPVFSAHMSPSTSLKNVIHLGQISNSGNFAQFDYGLKQNRLLYNSSKPLIYELKKVTMPIALISAKNDRMSTASDVDILRSKLPNVVSDVVIPKEEFNHVDYIWGEHTNTYLHPYILSLLEKYY